jgi:hypothetical protein
VAIAISLFCHFGKIRRIHVVTAYGKSRFYPSLTEEGYPLRTSLRLFEPWSHRSNPYVGKLSGAGIERDVPRLTEKRYPSFVTMVRVKLENAPRTLARREFAMNIARDAISLTACFANATVSFVDQYCAVYENLFPEVRSDDDVSSSCI